MLTPDPARERPRSKDEVRRASLLPARLAGFRRLYRWLNLTLIHQGLWPLLLVMAGAPAVPLAATLISWYLARLAGPALAALLAAVYLAQKPSGARVARPSPDDSGRRLAVARLQAGQALAGIALTLAVARLLVGPTESVAKLLTFGVADVLAFQLVHFGVVARSWPDAEAAAYAAVGLFACSWGLRELFLAAAGGIPVDLPLAFGGGAAVGLAVGALSWLLRRWPGGFWPAASAHFIVVYLVAGFA